MPSANMTEEQSRPPGAQQDGCTPAQLDAMVSNLLSPKMDTRLRARDALVGCGGDAVPALLEALTDKNHHLRWEAAQVLIAIADPRTAPDLARALDDENAGVRWLAAEALIALGRPGLREALRALVEAGPAEPRLAAGVHHVLRELQREGYESLLQPVLNALRDFVPDEVAIVEAHYALEKLDAA